MVTAKSHPWDQHSSGGRNRVGASDQTETVDDIPENAYSKVRSSATGLIKDALRLADLQMQLAVVDVKEFWRVARFGLVLALVASVGLLASCTVFLIGLSEVLNKHYQFSIEMAHLTVSGISIVIGVMVLLIGVSLLSRAATKLQRTQVELQENLLWVRSILSSDDE